MENETILYGVKVGDPDYAEVILSSVPANFERVKRWATRDGFDRFRIAEINLSEKPDFTKTINTGGQKRS